MMEMEPSEASGCQRRSSRKQKLKFVALNEKKMQRATLVMASKNRAATDGGGPLHSRSSKKNQNRLSNTCKSMTLYSQHRSSSSIQLSGLIINLPDSSFRVQPCFNSRLKSDFVINGIIPKVILNRLSAIKSKAASAPEALPPTKLPRSSSSSAQGKSTESQQHRYTYDGIHYLARLMLPEHAFRSAPHDHGQMSRDSSLSESSLMEPEVHLTVREPLVRPTTEPEVIDISDSDDDIQIESDPLELRASDYLHMAPHQSFNVTSPYLPKVNNNPTVKRPILPKLMPALKRAPMRQGDVMNIIRSTTDRSATLKVMPCPYCGPNVLISTSIIQYHVMTEHGISFA